MTWTKEEKLERELGIAAKAIEHLKQKRDILQACLQASNERAEILLKGGTRIKKQRDELLVFVKDIVENHHQGLQDAGLIDLERNADDLVEKIEEQQKRKGEQK